MYGKLRRLRRFRLSRRPMVQLLLSALVGGAVAAGLILLFQQGMRPILEQLAGAQVNNLVVTKINDVIRREMAAGTLDSDGLITLERDEDGRITALTSDMAAAERLRSGVADLLAQELEGLTAVELSIPVGSLTGSALLSGRGPSIPVRVLSAGAVDTAFENQFTDAGINQTRYQVVLNIRVEVTMLLPGGPAETEVTTQVVAAETILLGEVPEYYAQFSTPSSQTETITTQ